MKDCRVFQCLAVWESFLLSQRGQPASEQTHGQGSPWTSQRLPEAVGSTRVAGKRGRTEDLRVLNQGRWRPSHPRCLKSHFWPQNVQKTLCLSLFFCLCNNWSVKRSHVIFLFFNIFESFKFNGEKKLRREPKIIQEEGKKTLECKSLFSAAFNCPGLTDGKFWFSCFYVSYC